MNIEQIKVSELRPFEAYPFKVQHDEQLEELSASIALEGVITPLMVRPYEEGGYEIISGHRRYEACKMAGIEEVPAIIRELSRDEATILMVDDNLTQRAEILPSEKAFAYKMKLDAMNRQGKRTDLTLSQVGKKLNSYEEMAAQSGESRSQIHRYVRLTYLEPELLDMVDQKRIAFGPAVELSYLAPQEQQELIETIESEEATPSISQAQRMRRMSEEGYLSMDQIFEVMTEVKGNQVETIKVPTELVQKHFKKFIPPKEMQDFIAKAVEHYCQYLINRDRSRNESR